MVDLVGFEPLLPARLRRDSRFSPLLSELAKARRCVTVGDRSGESPEDQGARDVLGVLSVGAPESVMSMRASADEALDDLESFAIPVLLVSGNVRPSFEPVEALLQLAGLAKQLGGNDKRLAAVVATVDEALALTAPLPSKAVQHLSQQLEHAIAPLNLPAGYVTETVERALLEERKYRYRVLKGERRLRCELELEGASLPLYLPAEMATRLPLLPSFRALVLVELGPREDVAETRTEALFGLALGRTLKVRGATASAGC